MKIRISGPKTLPQAVQGFKRLIFRGTGRVYAWGFSKRIMFLCVIMDKVKK